MKHFRITIAALALIFSLAVVERIDAATFTVTNTNDSGAGSLRQAVLDANVNNQNDTIVFDAAVFNTPQTITLTSGQDYTNQRSTARAARQCIGFQTNFDN
jgi:hypothetical protein